MHAIKLILDDHEHVRHLLAQLDNTLLDKLDASTVRIRQSLFEELSTELLRHESMEQSFFYPFIKQYEPLKDVISHLIKEEKEATKSLAAFKGIKYDSVEWRIKYQKLKHDVEHHAKEEETRLFPKVISIIPEKLLNDIGNEMNTFKRNVKSSKFRP